MVSVLPQKCQESVWQARIFSEGGPVSGEIIYLQWLILFRGSSASSACVAAIT